MLFPCYDNQKNNDNIHRYDAVQRYYKKVEKRSLLYKKVTDSKNKHI